MMPPFDPSKMDPKMLMELSRVVQQLPPEQLNRMQSLMHNMMAGFDVSREMEEFEKTLPPGFKEKITALVGAMGGPSVFGIPGGPAGPAPKAPFGLNAEPAGSTSAPAATELPGSVKEARLTVLRAVAEGSMAPDQALEILFPSSA